LQFYSNSERVNIHYRRNEMNDLWTIRLLMKIGGGDPAMREVSGIHWHVSLTNRVEYVATDHSRQEIPWVKVTEGDGQVTIYQVEGSELTPEQVDSATPRSMDCIDCHNRPSHIYRAASRAVNHSMSGNRISTELPFIKRNALELLTAEYESTAEALLAIDSGVAAEYGDWREPAVVQRASEELQSIYSNNFFPEMKVDWRAYPNNVGHTLFPGCYRCHDGKHTSPDGEVISHDCNTCHIIIGQGPEVDSLTVGPEGLEFEHPTDIMGMWRQVNCAVCHAGGSM
jgi:hypothetical protein